MRATTLWVHNRRKIGILFYPIQWAGSYKREVEVFTPKFVYIQYTSWPCTSLLVECSMQVCILVIQPLGEAMVNMRTHVPYAWICLCTDHQEPIYLSALPSKKKRDGMEAYSNRSFCSQEMQASYIFSGNNFVCRRGAWKRVLRMDTHYG